MNSSQTALIANGLTVLVSALVLASAQRRVLMRAPPRLVAYAAAWLICALLLGALRSLGDHLVGRVGAPIILGNLAWTAAVCAASLFAADGIVTTTRRAREHAAGRWVALFVIHAAVVTLASLI